MRINSFLLASIGVVMITLCGCGGSSSKESSEDFSITGLDGKVYESYREACRAGDFEAAHKYLDYLNMKLDKKDGYNGDIVREITNVEEYIFNNEVNYLVSLKTKEANARIIFLLNEKPIKGTAYPEGTCIEKDVNIHYYPRGERNNYGDYIRWVADFNSKCMDVLNISISQKNKELAEQIVPMFREDAQVEYQKEHHEPSYNFLIGDIYAHYTKESIEQAKKKYGEAFGNQEEIEENVKCTPKETRKKRRK